MIIEALLTINSFYQGIRGEILLTLTVFLKLVFVLEALLMLGAL